MLYGAAWTMHTNGYVPGVSNRHVACPRSPVAAVERRRRLARVRASRLRAAGGLRAVEDDVVDLGARAGGEGERHRRAAADTVTLLSPGHCSRRPGTSCGRPPVSRATMPGPAGGVNVGRRGRRGRRRRASAWPSAWPSASASASAVGVARRRGRGRRRRRGVPVTITSPVITPECATHKNVYVPGTLNVHSPTTARAPGSRAPPWASPSRRSVTQVARRSLLNCALWTLLDSGVRERDASSPPATVTLLSSAPGVAVVLEDSCRATVTSPLARGPASTLAPRERGNEHGHHHGADEPWQDSPPAAIHGTPSRKKQTPPGYPAFARC